jgi:hypothetical protein
LQMTCSAASTGFSTQRNLPATERLAIFIDDSK